MCPAELRDNYEDGKEGTLVRLLVRLLPAEYDLAVKAVKDLARLRKYSEGGMLGAITNCEDNSREITQLTTYRTTLSFASNSSTPIS
jgi:hypothetical protein